MSESKGMDHVYLAARYQRWPELRGRANELRALGFAVTSRWIEGGHEMSKEGSTEAAMVERRRFAREDLDDLLRAKTIIAFTEPPRSTASRGGRHVEFGVAVALGLRLIVVGPRENVFHCLAEVEQHETWAELLAVLRGERQQEG